VDGEQHAEQVAYDDRRTAWLEDRGFRVLRFWNSEVLRNTEGVWETIALALSPTALEQG
jgi:very-short-patch-repair endonuclease